MVLAEGWGIEQYAEDDPRRVRTALRAFWGGLAYELEGLTDEQWERAGTCASGRAVTGETPTANVRPQIGSRKERQGAAGQQGGIPSRGGANGAPDPQYTRLDRCSPAPPSSDVGGA